MKRIVTGTAIVVVLAALGGFGFQAWLKNKVQTETEQSFAALRASGVDARFTSTDVSLLDRKVNISGVRIASGNGDSVLDIDRLILRISSAPTSERMQADDMAFSGVRMTLKGEPAGGGEMVYTIPDMTVRGYDGPVSLLPSDQHGGPYAALRLGLRQFATLKADEVLIPQASILVTPAPAMADAVRTEVTYRTITLDKIDAGKVQKLSVAQTQFKTTPVAPPPQGDKTATEAAEDEETKARPTAPGSGEIRDIAIHDIDSAPVLAATNPADEDQKAAVAPVAAPKSDAPKSDAPYQSVFRLLETGPHTITLPESTSKAASTRIEKLGIRPEAFAPERVAALSAINLNTSSTSLEDAQRALALTSGLIEAVSIGKVEIKDNLTQEEGVTSSIGLLVLENISNGVLNKLEMKDAQVQDKDGLTRFGRFAINKLDMPALNHFSEMANESLPDAALMLFRIISGFEMENVSVPDSISSGTKGEQITLGKMSLTWGELLGDAPTQLELTIADLSSPISEQDDMPFSLLAGTGMKRANAGVTVKVNYDQASQTLSIAPFESTLNGALKVQVGAKLDNVAKEIFTEEGAMEEALMNITVGPVSVALTNEGLAQILLQQLSKDAGVSEDAYRQQIIETLTELVPALSDAPETAQVLEAVISFIKNPKTLTLTATPKTTAPLIELMYQEDPTAIAQFFTISAKTSP